MTGTFSDSAAPKRLYRSRRDRKVLGVLGGLGDYFGVDPTVARLIFVVLDIMTGVLPAILAYFICAAIIPDEPQP